MGAFDVRETIAGNALSASERALLLALPQGRGAKAQRCKAISDAVSAVMSSKIEMDGSELTVAEALTVKVVAEAMADPSAEKLKVLASIVGDVGATRVEITTSLVDEELERAALGEEDGEV